jgi:hypothetical protein
MKEWGQRLPATWIKRLPGVAHLLRAIADAPTDLLRDPVLLAQTGMLGFAIFALDALTLWLVLRGLGDNPAIWVAFVSFVMASMAATLGPIPSAWARSRRLASACSICSASPSKPRWRRRCRCAASPLGFPCPPVCGSQDSRSPADDRLAISDGRRRARR